VQCHEIDYEILGNDLQIVEVELDPGETVIAEAGVMNYMEDGIEFDTRMGDGSFGGEGFILQRLNGDGKAFIHAGGTVIKKKLQGGKNDWALCGPGVGRSLHRCRLFRCVSFRQADLG